MFILLTVNLSFDFFTKTLYHIQGELNDSKYTDEYRLVGYDVDGDGIVDIKAGEFFVVTKDMTLKAIYTEEPTRIWG